MKYSILSILILIPFCIGENQSPISIILLGLHLILLGVDIGYLRYKDK